MGTMLFIILIIVLVPIAGLFLIGAIMNYLRSFHPPQQSVPEVHSCPHCGAHLPQDAPEGLCPRCLMHQAIPSPWPTPARAPAVHTGPPRHGSFAAPALADLTPLFTQLEIQELLGQGGMGAVYKARHAKLDRLVALKILPSEPGQDSAFADRFTREARALAKLSHPNIVAVHDFGDAGGQFYLIMEFVDGLNLRQLMHASRLPANEALRIVSQICDALQYAHDEGIVHRDIKPENILIDKRGRVKIADFGLAKLLNRTPVEMTLTATHQIMGTPHYMAPEQMERPQSVDHRADIYSLGVLFYEMLTGELPMGRFALPSQKAGVDSRLDEIVLRALEKDPDRRYQKVSEVKSEVESLARGLPVFREPAVPTLTYQEEMDQEMLRLQIKVPAVGLMLTGAVAVVFWSIMALVFAGAERQWWHGQETYLPPMQNWAQRPTSVHLVTDLFIGGVVILALAAAVSLLVSGARSMMRLDRFEFAVFASIWAMIPWSGPGILVGIPFGILSLIILHKPNVRAAFVRNALRARRRSLVPPTGRDLDMLRLQSRGPAILLKVTALVALVQWVVLGVVYAVMDYGRWRIEVMFDTGKFPTEFIVIPLVVGIPLLISVGILFSAARRLSRFEDYGFVTVASLWAMLPWSAGFLIGFPAGLWTLLFLRRHDVRLAFLNHVHPEMPGSPPRGPARGGIRSMLVGIQSLFLGSRATAPYLHHSEGPNSAGSRPSLFREVGRQSPQPPSSPGGSGPSIGLWLPWVFGIVFVLAIGAVALIRNWNYESRPPLPTTTAHSGTAPSRPTGNGLMKKEIQTTKDK
ncbi:MAG: serine/threonine-protein kinase [Gemmataceae bacterium]